MSLPTRVDRALAVRYATDGFVVLRNVFAADEMAAAAVESERLFARRDLIDINNIRCRWQNHFQTGECRFDTFDPVTDLSATMRDIARDSRILEIVSSLYGEQACLFKDKLIFKPPGARRRTAGLSLSRVPHLAQAEIC